MKRKLNAGHHAAVIGTWDFLTVRHVSVTSLRDAGGGWWVCRVSINIVSLTGQKGLVSKRLRFCSGLFSLAGASLTLMG